MLNSIKNKISFKTKVKIRNIIKDTRGLFCFNNLDKLAQLYKTDKFGKHFYTPHYQFHFSKFKYKKFKMLEIGVGGHENPLAGGPSLRMWKRFFPFAQIYALDIFDKSFFQEKRVRIFQGSQVDKVFLAKMLEETGELDIIVDDGSHINEHVIETFKILFPKLKEGGIYVVEDAQTSYYGGYFGGDNKNFNNLNTSMGFFKSLVDGLNSEEYGIEGYERNYYDKNIISIHFYHSLIFIYKGNNNEGASSNIDFSRD
jgi:demethylmacrocin O-methyltransferase